MLMTRTENGIVIQNKYAQTITVKEGQLVWFQRWVDGDRVLECGYLLEIDDEDGYALILIEDQIDEKVYVFVDELWA